jgi:hypothetical protein
MADKSQLFESDKIFEHLPVKAVPLERALARVSSEMFGSEFNPIVVADALKTSRRSEIVESRTISPRNGNDCVRTFDGLKFGEPPSQSMEGEMMVEHSKRSDSPEDCE